MKTLLFMFLTLLMVSAHSTEYNYGNYVLTNQGGVKTTTSTFFGSWDGAIMVKPSNGPTSSHTVQFEISSPNYFSPQNIGHISVGVRGSATNSLQGRGIVIGNLTEYTIVGQGCSKTPYNNTIAIESYWTTSNCVWGETTSSEVFQNNVKYRVTVSNVDAESGDKAKIIKYKVERWNGWTWYPGPEQAVYDYKNSLSSNFNGWWLLEAFSTHDWTIYINNVKEIVE